jgi:tetratricopeptide (TPR) repeat protein
VSIVNSLANRLLALYNQASKPMSDRPNAFLLLAPGAVAIVFALFALGMLPVGAAFLLVVGLFVLLLRTSITTEDVFGLLTPLAVLFAAAGVVALSLSDPSTDWLWARLLACLVGVVFVLWLTALQWSHSWFLATGLLLVLLLVALLVRVGFRAEADALFREPISSAVEEVGSLEEAAAEAAKVRETAAAAAAAREVATLRAASDEAIEAFGSAIPDASEPFRTGGAAVLAGLTVGDMEDLAGDLARLRALPVSADRATQDVLVRTSAISAVDAFQALMAAGAAGDVEPPPSSEAVRAAIADACRAVAEGVEVAACKGRETDPGASPPPVDSAAALHRLDVALAYYRSAVSPDDESLRAAAEAAAGTEPVDLETSLFDAVVAGPRVVVTSIDPDSALRLVPGPLGWLVLGALALWTLRRLLERNALQMPGPVAVDYDGDHKEVLRVAVLQNLKTPAASPGSAVVQSVTDLSALTGPEKKGIAAVVAALTSVFTFDRGYVVTADLSPPPAPAVEAGETPEGTPPGPTTVLASVRARSSDESLGSRSFTHETPETAMRAAGLWAAGFLLERSTRIPTWASWTAATAQSLDATTSSSPSLAQLEKAAKAAPTSGWILLLYGHELELAGRERDAIGVYARAVVAHPRYLVARYRLAAALGMLGRDVSRWITASFAERTAVGNSVGVACQRLGLDASLAQSLLVPAAAEEDFHQLAAELLRSIEDDSWWLNYQASQLRRSDRDQSWLKWRGRPNSRRKTMWLARSGRLVYLTEATERNKLLKKVEAQASKPSSSWQLSYNLACSYAVSDADAALRWLETCLMRPGVQQLNAKWVRADEDLAPLAPHPRFAHFCAQIEQDVDEEAT